MNVIIATIIIIIIHHNHHHHTYDHHCHNLPFLRLPSNKLKRSFNYLSTDSKTPLRDMKPYAPGFSCRWHRLTFGKFIYTTASVTVTLIAFPHLPHFSQAILITFSEVIKLPMLSTKIAYSTALQCIINLY